MTLVIVVNFWKDMLRNFLQKLLLPYYLIFLTLVKQEKLLLNMVIRF